VDEQQRQNLCDDLRGILKGQLLFDDLTRALYSTDASIFQVQPLGVVVPQDEEDVQNLVRYAAEHKIPLIPRGAGSGVAGEALGSGLVVDLSRNFRSILEIETDTVRVQPGVVYRDLNVELAKVGRCFAPDPASGAQCTIGGMLATNASGAHALRHGYTRDHVVFLRVVLDTGDAVPVGRHSRWPATVSANGADSQGKSGAGHLNDIVLAVADLLEQNAELIRTHQPRTRFNRCGYLLHDVLSSDQVDLSRLLVGSEGTLAFFTEATLRTIPIPVGRSMVLLGFGSLEGALRAVPRVLEDRPAACELIERRLLNLTRAGDAADSTVVPPSVGAVLLVEFESDTPREARHSTDALIDRLHRTERQAIMAVSAFEPEEIDRLWRLRESALPSLYGLRGGAQAVAFVEDVGVPVEELPRYVHRVQEALQQLDTTASFLIHAGAGQVHTRPFLDLSQKEDVAKLSAIAEQVHSLALDLGGTVSTQHGTGLARTPWVARQYGRLYPVFREIKAVFDPRQIFNPGKIIDGEAAGLAWPLRRQPSAEGAFNTHLRWSATEVRNECVNCNGCGQCRTEAPAQRMCPLFRATHGEAATPRAKANLLRYLLQPGSDARLLSSEEVREVADLCVNCKMCAHECPAHVNVPRLMLEVKAAHVAEHGLSRSDWVLARTESFAAIGNEFAALVNGAMGNRAVRWLLEKFFGVSRRRGLPRFAPRSFLQQASRRGWTRFPRSGRPRVAYFVDVFANYNDPLIAEAAVRVLKHNGFDVYVPPGQLGCGMAPLAQGDVETACETISANLRLLAEWAREAEGPIVCSEPTAALVLRQDMLTLIDDPDARAVADRTVELTSFLWDLHQAGCLRTDFQPLDISLGHHVPCHLKALGRPPAGPGLLALIPRLRVHTIDVSCSGMAGTFGLKAENYEVSLQAGRPMLQEFARARVLFGSTECSTCRLQMEDGGRKRTLHPVQYLALAYGLMPELTKRLEEPVGELVL
jgi:FAD/FMN-containing dehydrogenase/Fe-S oxidoreductase